MPTYRDERFPFPSPGRLRRELRLGRPPWRIIVSLLILVVIASVPIAMMLHVRGTLSPKPRVQPFQDMAVRPGAGPQAESRLFADGRAMRPPVPGAVARGRLADDDHYYRGYRIERDPDTGAAELRFYEDLPERVEVTDRLLTRGREMYMAHCVACHGQSGRGEGLVSLRAIELNEPGWVPPTSLLDEQVLEREAGHLYNSIRQGIRSMPPLGTRIDTADRWAVVAWVRQLQQAEADEQAPPGSPAPPDDQTEE